MSSCSTGTRGTAGRLASHLGLHRLVLVGVVASSYLRLFDFSNSTFDVALRAFLSEFRMPGEGQVVDRFMNRFSAAFCEQHEGIFADPDAAYVLSYSMMMLNTTLHNPNVDVCGVLPQPCGFEYPRPDHVCMSMCDCGCCSPSSGPR